VAAPLRIALVDDYDIVLLGLAHLLDGYRSRVVVAEIDANEPVIDDVDIVLYDSFAQPEADLGEIGVLVGHPGDHRVVVYTWNFHPELIDAAFAKGASGYLSKTLPARQLVEAVEAIHGGETVISPKPPKGHFDVGLDWPGKSEGLTSRESEILALITQGKSNDEVAALTYLSKNSIKAYIRSTYRKIGVTSRTQAVLWGVDHDFKPDHHRIDHWRHGPWPRPATTAIHCFGARSRRCTSRGGGRPALTAN
jgi:DNA-binding NarL/FixJ family response regulator